MRILAIETTGRHGSLAALDGDSAGLNVLRELRLDGGRTAQILAPTLQELLVEVGWPAASVELVAVAVGPGSFTGLRIGVSTAKTFAYAVGAQIMGVETMEALATQAPAAETRLWTLMDAQRQELFVARFSAGLSGPLREEFTHIVSQKAWLTQLQAGDRVIGPPLGRLQPKLPDGVNSAPESCWQPTAAAIGEIAWQAFQRGERGDVWQLAPIYGRLSAAEEKRNEARMTNDE